MYIKLLKYFLNENMLAQVSHMMERQRKIHSVFKQPERKPRSLGVLFSTADKTLQCLESIKLLLNFKPNLLIVVLGNTITNLT